MPSHCIYAMDQAKLILGEASYFEQQLGESIYKRITPVNRDSTYKYSDIWSVSKGDLLSFVNRPLGIKIVIDSTWHINFYDYSNHQSIVTIEPPAITNSSGRAIRYTIALFIKVNKEEEKLESFINKFIAKFPLKNIFDFSDKYEEMISYELKDPMMYPDIGGGHFNMVGIKRDRPNYPGLLLEEPSSIPRNGVTNKVTYYRAGERLDRFEGQIYYAVMLDACEDIFPEASKLFKDFFEQQVVIE